MIITTWVKYTEGFLPTPRHRKLRYRECEEYIDVELKEVTKADLTLSLVVGSDFENLKGLEIYSYKENLYRVASCDDISAREDAETPLVEMIYCRKHCSTYFGFSPESTKDAMIQKASSDMEKYLLVDGVLYIKTSEPMYTYTTFGLGRNHGGTGIFVTYNYNPNRSNKCYFNALERDLAVQEAITTASLRGDTESIERIKNISKIEIRNGYVVKRNPKLDHVE